MFTKSGRKIALEILCNSGGYANVRKFRLATNVPAGDPADVVETDFTEATFDGYAEKVDPPFTPAILDGSDRGKVVFDTMIWTAGASVSSQTVLSIYCYIAASYSPLQGLLWWMELPAPVTVATPGETVSQIVTWYGRDFVP